MEKPVGRWFVQMESKIPILEISVWGGVYHLNNRPNLPKEHRTSLDIFKMAAELVLLSEALDASIDEELLLDHEEDEEFQVIAATSAFMKRELKRNVGFCEVVVRSYSIEEFKSHFRMTKTTFEVLARELVATGSIPAEEIVLEENAAAAAAMLTHLT